MIARGVLVLICVIVYVAGEQVGHITVYSECEYCDSINSIVSNIYGMHAFLKEQRVPKNIQGLSYCVVIGYNASAGQQIRDEQAAVDELHYIYKKNNTMIDFCIYSSYVSDEIYEIMESVEMFVETK